MAGKAAAASSSKRAREVRFRNLICELQFSNLLLPSKNQDTPKDSNSFLFKNTIYHSLQLSGVKQNFNAGKRKRLRVGGMVSGSSFQERTGNFEDGTSGFF